MEFTSVGVKELEKLKVKELQNLLGELSLSVQGKKEELIQRVISANLPLPDWFQRVACSKEPLPSSQIDNDREEDVVSEEENVSERETEDAVLLDVRTQPVVKKNASFHVGVGQNKRRSKRIARKRQAAATHFSMESADGIGTLRKELELMRKEKDLLARENELLKREHLLNGKEKQSEENKSEANSSVAKVRNNYVQINEMLPCFDGTSYVSCWIGQIKTVQRVYNIPDGDMKILMINKFSGIVKNWFYSKPEFIELAFEQLIGEVKQMFDCRIEKLKLRRSFENRKWLRDESFARYFHEKVILGNQLSVPDDELIEYLIDGINNPTLQAQVRIKGFTSPSEMLSVMSKLTVAERNGMKDNLDRPSSSKPTRRPNEMPSKVR